MFCHRKYIVTIALKDVGVKKGVKRCMCKEIKEQLG